MFFYILYRIGYFLANILPLRFAYGLANIVSDLQYFIAKKDREAVAENMSTLLKKDVSECHALSRKVFRNFGLYLVDFFRMPNLTKKDIDERVKITGIENIQMVLGQNRGAVILTCHIGNWEMGGVVMAMLGYDMSDVALNHKHKSINDFFIKQREKKGLKVITINFIMKRCISALRRKGLLALLGDRDFTNNGIIVNFFGIPTSIPKGPAMLSLKTNSAVIPGIFVREGRFNYNLIFDKPVEINEEADISQEEVIKKATERFVAIMEKYIRIYPDQWLIFRRFWETPTDAFVL